MADKQSLKEVESHFKFGENWASYSQLLNDERIAEAVKGLEKLIPASEIKGKTFLDIGSGSGLHSLAAAHLGAKRIVAIDIDPDSVKTTRDTLSKYAPDADVTCEQVSVFELPKRGWEKFDIVYSWGVLHHTGDLEGAIRAAAAMVKPGGVLAVAFYRKTPFCEAWKLEKRWYKDASPAMQKLARQIYAAAFRVGLLAKGQFSFEKYLSNFKRRRGMEFHHDIHDWMGSYPYESISPAEAEALMAKLGFKLVRSFVKNQSLVSSLFGSGCDEFVFVAN